jgi:hypothetical protein
VGTHEIKMTTFANLGIEVAEKVKAISDLIRTDLLIGAGFFLLLQVRYWRWKIADNQYGSPWIFDRIFHLGFDKYL